MTRKECEQLSPGDGIFLRGNVFFSLNDARFIGFKNGKALIEYKASDGIKRRIFPLCRLMTREKKL